jgi:protein O-mannosyl-transferase
MPPRAPFVTRRTLLLGLMLVALTWAVYARACRFDLVSFDDPAYVNSQVKQGLSLHGVHWAFVGYHDANWIPLVWLSLMLDTTIFGSSPSGYHIINVLSTCCRRLTKTTWPIIF